MSTILLKIYTNFLINALILNLLQCITKMQRIKKDSGESQAIFIRMWLLNWPIYSHGLFVLYWRRRVETLASSLGCPMSVLKSCHDRNYSTHTLVDFLYFYNEAKKWQNNCLMLARPTYRLKNNLCAEKGGKDIFYTHIWLECYIVCPTLEEREAKSRTWFKEIVHLKLLQQVTPHSRAIRVQDLHHDHADFFIRAIEF